MTKTVILLYLLVVRGPEMLPTSDLHRQMAEFNQRVAPAGYEVRIKRIRTIPDFAPRAKGIAKVRQRYARAVLYAIRRGYIRRAKWVTSFIVQGPYDPPSGKRWNYGLARGRCMLTRYPLTLTTSVDYRPIHTEVALWHELGHILGARHDSTIRNYKRETCPPADCTGREVATIMHPDALRYVREWGLWFSMKSIEEMGACNLAYRWGLI